MKNNFAMITVITLGLVANNAFAKDGVKVLPADATNVAVSHVELAQVATGEELINWGGDGGDVYQPTYSTMLSVDVTYDSSDDTDVPNQQIGSDLETIKVGKPTYSVNLPLTAAQVAGVKNHSIDPTTLVSISVVQSAVTFDDVVFGPSCRFDADHNGALNEDTCLIHTPRIENRPVLTVNHK